jgi:hypothetical protein
MLLRKILMEKYRKKLRRREARTTMMMIQLLKPSNSERSMEGQLKLSLRPTTLSLV